MGRYDGLSVGRRSRRDEKLPCELPSIRPLGSPDGPCLQNDPSLSQRKWSHAFIRSFAFGLLDAVYHSSSVALRAHVHVPLGREMHAIRGRRPDQPATKRTLDRRYMLYDDGLFIRLYQPFICSCF